MLSSITKGSGNVISANVTLSGEVFHLLSVIFEGSKNVTLSLMDWQFLQGNRLRGRFSSRHMCLTERGAQLQGAAETGVQI